MFDTEEWLNEIVQDGVERHKRLCFLITANGGLDVHGWGFLSFGNGHQRGLEQNDALELMQYSAFMDGLSSAGVDIDSALKPYFDAYISQFGDEISN